MKVVFVYQYYQDHRSPGHSLIYEYAQHLAERGHGVTVISGDSGYMKAEEPSQPWYRRLHRVEHDEAVRVVRTFVYAGHHRNYFSRLLTFISFTLSCPLGFIGLGRPDVVFVSSPPLFPVFAAWVICAVRRIPVVTEVRDLWPESAVQMGLLKNRVLIRVMHWMEKLLYEHSQKVVTLTTGIRDDIVARGWPLEKTAVITCGVDVGRLRPDPPAGASLRSRLGWKGQKIVMYFGAMGQANNLPVIQRASERLKHRSDILFVLVGDGMKRVELEHWVSRCDASNVLVLPAVPKEQGNDYLNAADACVVTLQDIPLFDGAIPTKLIDYMACGKPVIGGVRGEAKRILDDARAGIAFPPDDDEALAKAVLDLIDDPAKAVAMGANGRTHVEEHFAADELRDRFEAVLLSAGSRQIKTGRGEDP